jgi:hypothetical protein
VAWEYKTHFSSLTPYHDGTSITAKQSVLTDAELTELGSQGWELVNVVHLSLCTTQGEHYGTALHPNQLALGYLVDILVSVDITPKDIAVGNTSLR